MIAATDGVYSDSSGPTLWRRFGRLLVLTPLVLLLLATHIRLHHPILRGLEIAAKVTRMSDELNGLQAENERLRRAVEHLQTEEGKECAARRALGVVAPGERLIVLADPAPADSARPRSLAEHTQACIVRGRMAATRGLHQAGRICGVWIGLQDADSLVADRPAPPPADAPGPAGAEMPAPPVGTAANHPQSEASADLSLSPH